MSNVTELLVQWGRGDDAALDRLVPLVHHELHQIASRHMAHERGGHTLQPTALVNETYLRLVEAKNVTWQDRAHFLAVSAQVMRRILVDHARARRSQKRGGDVPTVTFDEAARLLVESVGCVARLTRDPAAHCSRMAPSSCAEVGAAGVESDSSSPNTATTPDDPRTMSSSGAIFTLRSLWPKPTSRLETKPARDEVGTSHR